MNKMRRRVTRKVVKSTGEMMKVKRRREMKREMETERNGQSNTRGRNESV